LLLTGLIVKPHGWGEDEAMLRSVVAKGSNRKLSPSQPNINLTRTSTRRPSNLRGYSERSVILTTVGICCASAGFGPTLIVGVLC
jgi:hypothetical protein